MADEFDLSDLGGVLAAPPKSASSQFDLSDIGGVPAASNPAHDLSDLSGVPEPPDPMVVALDKARRKLEIGSIGPDTRSPIRQARDFINQRLDPISRLWDGGVATELNPKQGLNKAFPSVTAEDVAKGNLSALMPGVDPDTGESLNSLNTPGYQAPVAAKIGAGIERGVARTADALAPWAIAGGPIGLISKAPLAGRAISAAFAADMISGLPDTAKAFIKAVETGDVQTAVETGISGTLGALFTYKAAQHAVGRQAIPRVDATGNPVNDPKTGNQIIDYIGIAEESPAIRRLLTKRITTEFKPEQVKDMIARVADDANYEQRVREGYAEARTPTATPAEVELVRFINKAFESPGQAVRQGVTITKETPKIESQFWRDYLGLKPSQTTLDLMGGQKGTDATNPEQQPPSFSEQPQGTDGERKAIQGPVVSDSLPRPAGQPAQRPFTPPPPVVTPESAPVVPEVKFTDLNLPYVDNVQVRQKDGATITAQFNGYYDFGAKGILPSIGYPSKGGVTHGPLRPGDQLLTQVPTPQQWDAIKQAGPGAPVKSTGTTEPNPTDAQIEAGNAPKRKVSVHGLNISIENEAGSIRRSKPDAPVPWEVKMPTAYGYIKGTEDKTGEQMDVYLGPEPERAHNVYVIDQIDPDTKKYDEPKIMLGFPNGALAARAYIAAFSDNKGQQRIGAITPMPLPQFKDWLKSGDMKKAVAYQVEKTKSPAAILQSGRGAKLPEQPAEKPEAPAPMQIIAKGDWVEYEDSYGKVRQGKVDEAWTTAAIVPTRSGVKTRVIRHEFSIVDASGKAMVSPKEGTPLRKIAAPIETKEPTLETIGELSETDLDAMLDEAKTGAPKPAPVEKPKPAPAIRRPKPKSSLMNRPPPGGWTAADKVPKPAKSTTDILKDAAKEGIKGADEAMKGLHDLFGGGSSVASTLGLPPFDEETYAKAKPHFEEAYNSFKKAGRSLADFLKFIFQKFGERIRPYLKRFVQEMQAKEKMGKRTPSMDVADWVKSKLNKEEAFTSKELFEHADKAFGGTQGEAQYTPKDAYDAMELGVNQFIADDIRFKIDWVGDPAKVQAAAIKAIEQLKRLASLLPTQTKRTAEMDEFQQFSTPPPLAYVVAWVANISPTDVVLEPSAGIGGIAVFAKNAGARVIVNELSARRAELLKQMGFDQVFTENGEQLNNILPADVKPTVVTTNPPFSATAGRMQGARKTIFATQHLEQDLARLEPGGRLVAIVGEGMAADRPAFKAWWKSISQRYHVLANIGISGDEHKKYGTSFGNQIIVIDKPLPNEVVGLVPPQTGKVQKIEELIPLLEETRNERKRTTGVVEPPTTEPTREEAAGSSSASPGSKPAASIPTGGVGSQPVGAVGGKPGTPARPDGQPPSAPAGGSTRVPAIRRPVAPEGKRPTGERPAEPAKPTGSGGAPPASAKPAREPADTVLGQDLTVTAAENAIAKDLEVGSVFENYKPQIQIKGALPHPTPLSESSAMSSVKYPVPNYKPSLPGTVLTTGALSAPQFEAVMLAGAAHARTLPDGRTRGFFVGDGTGVGKGRTNAAIFFDNWNKGKKKGVWFTADQKLFEDAKRDIEGIGWNKDVLFLHKKTNPKEPIETKQGILFSAYSLLRNEARFKQIVDWLGKDFDGVIVFDESHKMANAVETKGARGKKAVAGQALAGINLQTQFPKAKIVYVSATGATEVSNLAYAERLGIWGEGTPFANREAFIAEIGSKGVGAMEIVAKDLKSMGLYVSRNLSFDGVSYEQLEHTLTDKQRQMYDMLAGAWQMVLNHMNEALAVTEADKSGQAKSAARSAFWGAHQRFFNQILTSLQMPTVVEAIKKNLANGDATVLQLVNTNESQMERAISKATEGEEEADLETLDITPRETLIQYVENAFPVDQFEQYTDESGVVRSRPVLDSNGNRVKNAEAVAMREALINKLASVRVPVGALDEILETFGEANVAEVTGRTRRVVTKDTPEGRKKVIENRTAGANLADRTAFNDDKKKILVFSDAGGTGASYHADKNFINQRPRKHIVLQPGWRADNAIQGLGRSHRSNQKQPPHFVLASTDVPGHKRFVSTIARRVEQLGALTKGQRQTTSQGIFNARDNLESSYAKESLRAFLRAMAAGRIEGLDVNEFAEQTGLKMFNEDGQFIGEQIQIGQFLNRLLSLNLDMQGKVFKAFSDQLDATIEWHKTNGTLDVGMETLAANSTKLAQDQMLYTDPETQAKTKLIKLDLTHPTRLTTWDDAWLKEKDVVFIVNKRGGTIWKLDQVRTRAKSDGSEEHFRLALNVRSHREYMKVQDIDEDKFETVEPDKAKALWYAAYASAPKTYIQRVNLVTGTILPVWDRIPGINRIARAQEDSGQRHLGVLTHADYLPELEKNFGLEGKVELTPEQAVNEVLDNNATLNLANGWRILKRYVSGENRIEISGPDYSHQQELERNGVIMERIQYSMRYFIPNGDNAANVMGKIIKHRPIVEVQKRQRGGSQSPTLSLAPTGEPSESQPSENRTPLRPDSDRVLGAVVEKARERLVALFGSRLIPQNIRRSESNPPAVSGGPSDALSGDAQTALERAFGVKIVLLDIGGSGVHFNGVTFPEIPGYLFVNANAEKSQLVVAGHEFLENLKHEQPDLYAELREKILPLMQNIESYHARLLLAYARNDMARPGREHAEKEIIADFVGDSFTDPSFWQRLADKEPSLFKRLADAVLNFLRNLLAKLRKFGADQYFKDVDKAQEIVGDALVKFAKRTPGEGKPGEPAFSVDTTPPEDSETVKVMGADKEVGSSPFHLTASSTERSVQHTRSILTLAGVDAEPVTVSDDRRPGMEIKFWKFNNPDDAGIRRLIEQVKKDFALDRQGKQAVDLNANLIRSIQYNINEGLMPEVSLDVRRELDGLVTSETSRRGAQLGALSRHSYELMDMAHDPELHLSNIYSDAFGGDAYETLLKRMATHMADVFSDKEIADIIAKHPDLKELFDQAEARRKEARGTDTYRRVQAALKPKSPLSEQKLKSNALVQEAVREILAQAEGMGITPKARPGSKELTPMEKLGLMTTPETSGIIDKAITKAVRAAERNAARSVYEVEEEATPEQMQEYDARTNNPSLDGPDPNPGQIEQGLKSVKYAHWAVIRDSLLGYDPITVKLAQDIIRGDFRGTKFKATSPKASPADARINLTELAKSPETEVRRVLDTFYKKITDEMDMADATEDTKARVRQMIEENVIAQLEAAKLKVREPQFREPKEKGPGWTAAQRLGQQINAGLFADARLNIPKYVERVASKSLIQALTPTVTELTKQIMDTATAKQGDIKNNFLDEITRKLDLNPEQAKVARRVFEAAFDPRLKEARQKAMDAAIKSMTPREYEVMPRDDLKLWRKITRFLNAGGTQAGELLKQVAEMRGLQPPSAENIKRLKSLPVKIEELTTLTDAQKSKIQNNPSLTDAEKAKQITNQTAQKAAINQPDVAKLWRRMAAEWSQFARPINFLHPKATGSNIAAATMEVWTAGTLAKFGFPFRLAYHIGVGLASETATRPFGVAWAQFLDDSAKGRPTNFKLDAANALGDHLKQAKRAVEAALRAARAELAGRGQVKQVDALLAGINALSRAELAAQEYYQKGDYGRAALFYFYSLLKFSQRTVSGLDAAQREMVEYPEMRHRIFRELATRGVDRVVIERHIDEIFSGMTDKWLQAFGDAKAELELEGKTVSEADLKTRADRLLKERLWQEMDAKGLVSAKDRDYVTRRSLFISWQEAQTQGIGGAVGKTMLAWRKAGADKGIPLPLLFVHAISNGINFTLRSGPLYALADGRKAEWQKSAGTERPEDRMQNRVRALLWSSLGALAVMLVYAGILKVRNKYPTDKAERERFIADGHKIGTVEWVHDDGSFTPLSLTVGFMQPVSPFLAAAGSLVAAQERNAKAQAALDAQAAKLGLPAGKVKGLDAADLLAAMGQAAWTSIMGTATTSGMAAGYSEFGQLNVNKAIASIISPTIPFLPAYQEISRMMGVAMDKDKASVADYMLPSPTSGARLVNELGDPVRTPDDLQRVIQAITAGSFPGVVHPGAITAQPYQTMFDSNWSAPAINPGKGYNINGTFRPMNDDELGRYTQARGMHLKEALAGLDVSGMTPADAKKAVQAAYQRANASALADVGVSVPARATAGQVTAASASMLQPVTNAAAVGGLGRNPSSRTGIGGIRSLRSRSGVLSARRGHLGSVLRGRSLRPGRGLNLPKRGPNRVGRGLRPTVRV